jgi:hypothetical protein
MTGLLACGEGQATAKTLATYKQCDIGERGKGRCGAVS